MWANAFTMPWSVSLPGCQGAPFSDLVTSAVGRDLDCWHCVFFHVCTSLHSPFCILHWRLSCFRQTWGSHRVCTRDKVWVKKYRYSSFWMYEHKCMLPTKSWKSYTASLKGATDWHKTVCITDYLMDLTKSFLEAQKFFLDWLCMLSVMRQQWCELAT